MKQCVMLIRNIRSDMYGGGETYQLMLAEELLKNGREPIIVTSCDKLLSEAKRLGIKAVRAPFCDCQNYSGIRNLLFPKYVLWQRKLEKWYRGIFSKYQPEVVNIQSRDDWIAATKAAKKMRIRVFWTDHMDFRSWVLKNINIWYKNWIGKWILKCAEDVDKIIMISDFERKWFEKNVMPKKFDNIVTIKNGVCDEYAKYKNVKMEDNSFCYVGRVVDYKGIAELLEAFKLVHEEMPGAKLNIYGDGDLEKYIAMAGEGVKFYGYTNEPLRTMAENEIFVLPSYYEGLSMALLEAAMMGKKIIATNVDGNPEVVINNETGLLVPAKNVAKLAQAMKWMLSNSKEADSLARNARKKFEKEYDFDKIFAEKMLPLYNIEKEK